ncbi:MAG: hypothetical protein C0395_06505 [Gemmatimonas sp.]|nr:hypothetical protein [Gemmatimonas sp.]
MKPRPIVILLLAAAAFAAPARAQIAPADTSEVILRDDMSDDEKIAALNRLLVLNPRNSELYNDLGVIYAGREDWLSARDAFIAAIQSDPRAPASHRNLGLVMTKLEQYDMALSELDAYRNLAPDGGGDAWKLIADARRRSGDPEGAAAAYESGLEAYGQVFGAETCDLIMGRIVLAEAASDQQTVDAVLERYAAGARDHLAATGFVPADRTGLAAKALLERALRRRIDAAQAETKAGRHAAAAALYEAAMVLDPSRQDLLPLAALAWFDSGDAMKAKVMARRATQDQPERPDGWRALGRIAEAEDRSQDAIAAYTSAWNLDDSQDDVAAKIGTLYLRAGDNEGARKFMGAVVSSPDTPPEILFNYGLSLQRTDDHKLAVPPFYKAVEKDPGLIAAWKALAASLRQLERWHEAAVAYERALASERDPKLAFQLGTCLVKDGRPGDAIAAYRLALDLDPVYTKAWSNLGVVQMQVEDYVGALDSFRTLAALEDDVYRARLNEGVCLYQLGRYEEAIAAYEQALALQETSAVWENMGHVFDKLGDKPGAASCFKEGKRLKAEGK